MSAWATIGFVMKRAAMLFPLLVALLTLEGCSIIEEFYEKEILGVYAPEKLKEKQTEEGKAFLVESLNYYLSRLKDDRVRVFGPPSQCTALSPAGETCLWRSPTQQIAFAYDRDGYARSWAYEGPQGQFTSQDHKPRPAARHATVSKTQEPEWTHPQKPREAFAQDLNDCRLGASQAQQDQKNFASRSGAYLLMDQDIERCVRGKGWVQSGKR